jgi:chemotaxis protein MotB
VKLRSVIAVGCLSFSATACVSRGEYNDAVNTAYRARVALVQRAREDMEERSSLQQRIQTLEQKIEEAQLGRASMQKQVDDATAVDAQLSKELGRLGQNSLTLLSANEGLKGALESSRKRLEELRRAQDLAESRAALYRELALKLKGMIDSGDLAVVLRDGRMVVRMSNDVLFDSGKAELRTVGKAALAEVAAVLRTVTARRFQVAGHTDDEPIRLSAFRSNWELSTARGLEVVRFLVSQGIAPEALSAAGYAEFDPVDANGTSAGRSHNRRTEITLVPNIDELVAIPDAH